ncbi:MAG: hypothetical protein PHV49_02115 [Alistipes sp.]|nr:hypothetical protein [Alistipes sp.]
MKKEPQHPERLRRFRCYAGTLLLSLLCCAGCTSSALKIHADRSAVEMGRSVTLTVQAVSTPDLPLSQMMLMPYVNGQRWGAHEFPDSLGRATLLIPLPNVGEATLEVVAIARDTTLWCGLKDYTPYLTGKPMPSSGLHSNPVKIQVNRREFPARSTGRTAFVSQWEPWFAANKAGAWSTAQAIPLVGFYDFTNPDVLRQHLLWLMDSGADAVLFDWSNHIWGLSHWDERGDGVNQIVHNTEIALEVMADMRDEGLPVPQAIIMPGLSNGPPAKMEALNEQLQWIYHYMVRNPRFQGLWYLYDGKPLNIILDTGAMGVKEGTTESAFRVPFFKQTLSWSAAQIDALRRSNPPVDTSHFTLRWVSSQNQVTGHDSLGYWSWMDGSLHPTVTYRDSVAECTTVHMACFAENGWLAPEAWGRRDGWTLVESFKVALAHRPRVVMVHQFNEFTGQGASAYGPNRDIFVDCYSVDRSDDYEPASLTAPGFRGDRGGWGFYYLNLTRALVGVYREEQPTSTVMAVAPVTATGDSLTVEWTTVGVTPQGFTVEIDGQNVAEGVTGVSCRIPSTGLSAGHHTLTVKAEGATTRYALSSTQTDEPLQEPIPVAVSKSFLIP